MSLYSDYYFNSSPTVTELDCIEIQHFRFSPTIFRIVRNYNQQTLTGSDEFGNPRVGVIVTHEGGAGPFEYEYYPMKVERLGSGNDLDQSLRITLGDLGRVLPTQLRLVDKFNAFQTKPIVRYRGYRSDTLTAPLTPTPLVLEIKRISFNQDGCSFEAVAPYLNTARTGTIYNVKDFPTMKAFFKN